jgi:hypothetical protein
MGNQTSSQHEKNREKLMNIIEGHEKVTESFVKSDSSYKGYDSGRLTYSENQNCKEESTDTSSHFDAKEIKVKTMFEWREGGNTVYITGSFANWSQLFAMNKIANNKFELCLVL